MSDLVPLLAIQPDPGPVPDLESNAALIEYARAWLDRRCLADPMRSARHVPTTGPWLTELLVERLARAEAAGRHAREQQAPAFDQAFDDGGPL